MQVEFFTIGGLCERYTIARITLRRWVAQGRFPQPLRIGPRKALWPAAVVLEHERQILAAAEPEAKNATKEFA